MTKILELRLTLDTSGISFMELLPEEPDRYDITLSFMSLLSMIKNQGYDAEQQENFGEITVVRKDPEIIRAQEEAEAAGVNEYRDDEFDDIDDYDDDDPASYGYTETEAADVQ